ncbi:MAG TPA: hypothetical protein VHG27_09525 [Xanthobacteraceae bacterium]|nr:hypothetical protein [Xanthobacteraceae bacterium]
MRKLFFCLCGGVAALMLGDVAASKMIDVTTLGARMFEPAGLAQRPEVVIDRRRKGDRQAHGASASREHKIATVEVVGLEQAAIVYRDRDGRMLFRTDPVENTTVVVRGVTLPAVTVRETVRTPPRPLILQPPAPADSPQPQQQKTPKLPDGCEPAASPLSPSGTSMARARCLAELTGAIRIASLQ